MTSAERIEEQRATRRARCGVNAKHWRENMATREQMDTIRAMAMNDCAREMANDGVDISYSQSDSLGADALDWLAKRLGLTVRETDDCIVAEPVDAREKGDRDDDQT